MHVLYSIAIHGLEQLHNDPEYGLNHPVLYFGMEYFHVDPFWIARCDSKHCDTGEIWNLTLSLTLTLTLSSCTKEDKVSIVLSGISCSTASMVHGCAVLPLDKDCSIHC